MTELVPFLKDVLGRVQPFMSSISYIHSKELPDGRIIAKAIANDGTLVLTSYSKNPIDIHGARMCMGNLSYLSQLLHSYLLQSECEVDVVVRERNDKTVVSGIRFKPNGRMELNYAATDPFRASIAKPRDVDVSDWPVGFILDESAITEFQELRRIHMADKTSGQNNIIQIIVTNDAIAMDFGEGGSIQQSSLLLDVDVINDSKATLTGYFDSDQFNKAIIQAEDKSNMVELHMANNALRIVSENDIASHELVIVARKIRE